MRRIVTFLVVLLTLSMVACAADDPADAAVASTKGEVVLKVNEGVVFSTGETTNGSPQASDLIIYAHQSQDIDLKSGVEPNTTKHLQMRVFRTANNANAVFDNLDLVPQQKPTGLMLDDFLSKAANGNGCVVQNNISKGYTKIFVDTYNAPGKQVRLKYVVFE